MMPRFFLADPTLTTVSGHMWGYLQSLVRPVTRLGYQPVLLGNWQADQTLRETHRVTPAFECWFDARYGNLHETQAYHRQSIRADLKTVARAFCMGRRDVLLINTLRQWSLTGVVDWLESMPAERRPYVVLVMHFTAFPDLERGCELLEFYQEAFARIERSPVKSRILLMADTQELVDEYRQINDRLTCVLAPIPHAEPNVADEPARQSVNVGYIGEAKENKGFQFLPHLVRRVMDSEHAADVRFHVHAFCWDLSWTFYCRTVPQLAHPRVTLYHEILNDDEYGNLLAMMDIVVVPYTRLNYHSQTSGPFSEAMARGKTLVVPRGTWMARQIAEYGGGRTFNPGDVADFAKQVLNVLSKRDAYAAEGHERARRWCGFHNPHQFLRLVMEHAEGARRAA